MPIASDTTANALTALFLAIVRSAYRASCMNCSRRVHVHIARVSSCSSVTLPRSRRAAARAWSRDSPAASRSSASSLRWNSSSSRRSRSFCRRRIHQASFIRSSLRSFGSGIQQQAHCADEGVPLRVLARELLPAERGDAVVAGALALLGYVPRGGDPSRGFEAVEARIARTGLDLQQVFRGPLDVLRDRVPVARTGQQRLEDQEVERAAKEVDARGRLAGHCVESLHSIV